MPACTTTLVLEDPHIVVIPALPTADVLIDTLAAGIELEPEPRRLPDICTVV